MSASHAGGHTEGGGNSGQYRNHNVENLAPAIFLLFGLKYNGFRGA
jgi:hypothetical protein